MRRILAVCLAAFALLLYGCSGATSPVTDIAESLDAQSAAATEGAKSQDIELNYEICDVTVFYPEGSSEATAEYVLYYAFPVFSGEGAENANAALSLWEKELLERVSVDRLPYADRAENEETPFTRVEAKVTSAGVYTNVLFSEQAGYGAETETSRSAIVLNDKGEEMSLYALSDLYTPEQIVSQQVYNYIDAKDPARTEFYGDLTLSDIELALDLYNGFYLEKEAYVLLFQRGVLADESMGVVEIKVPFSSLYPDFVGETITAEDYARLQPVLKRLARACAAENHSFDEMPDALIATLFMGLTYEAQEPELGVIRVPKAEYENTAAAYFLSWPQDLSAGDGTVLADGEYRIPAVAVAQYGLRLDESQMQDDELLLRGVLLYGVPGAADWGELTPVTLRLQKSDKAAAGYFLTGFSYA